MTGTALRCDLVIVVIGGEGITFADHCAQLCALVRSPVSAVHGGHCDLVIDVISVRASALVMKTPGLLRNKGCLHGREIGLGIVG